MAAEPPELAELDLHHHEVLHALRAKGPVAWLPAVGGWVILSRALAIEVMRNPETFTVDDPRFTTAKVIGKSMLSLDGLEHRRHRDPFAAAFRPGEVARRDNVNLSTLARTMVQELQPRGHAELRRELAGPLAVAVSAGALGLDDRPATELLGWYDVIVAGVERASRGEEVGAAAENAFESLAGALRAVATRSDSVLASLTGDLSDAELVSNAAVFLFGGIETSEGMTANVLHHLLANPEQLNAVRDDSSLVEAAVEESLRLEPAAARVDRYATRDVELGGCRIAAGDFVAVSLAAANRDPEEFDQPDRFDVGRRNARTHLAFAQGPHVCLGSTLARTQAAAAVAAVLQLPADIHLTAPVRTAGVVFRKPLSLQVAWTIERATPGGAW
ncbi:MAG: cytochrome P450 [Actinobacteria bacterium]|nr:cytochrome P450 [Actinomycetota bacterium]